MSESDSLSQHTSNHKRCIVGSIGMSLGIGGLVGIGAVGSCSTNMSQLLSPHSPQSNSMSSYNWEQNTQINFNNNQTKYHHVTLQYKNFSDSTDLYRFKVEF